MNVLSPDMFPDRFEDEEHLEDFMSTPSQALIDDMKKIEGDIIILGVGGKMGVTLARLAKRAAPDKRILGVARFSEAGLEKKLQSWGIDTLVADLTDRQQVEALPKLPNVIHMAGKKFGTDGNEHFTWAMNTHVPALVGEAFPDSRIVVFSTILVYANQTPLRQGCTEDAPTNAMPGEYANSCVGRERIFQHFSVLNGTPMLAFRLCYSLDMRYGVVAEVAGRIHRGEPVDLAAGHVNAMWQGDANSQAIRCLLHCTAPLSGLNISGPETVSIHALATSIGKRMGREVDFIGEEVASICLVNGGRGADLFGYPMVPMERIVTWVSDWVSRDMIDWNKPSHYDTLNGVY
jgi:nucleoside-diphosphate-sugar epimerase